MQTLKELTTDKHREAESQPFLKSIFAGNVDVDKYTDYLYQLLHVYQILEFYADTHNLFEGIEDIKRSKQIEMDWVELLGDKPSNMVNDPTEKYINYIHSIKHEPNKIMAHVYVRHMGDLFGGQMLAKLLPGNNNFYKFDNIQSLVKSIREKIDISLAEEANVAFDHNINMIKVYND
jgi:heme oxygenase (biliverdin-producing, ferredoxin)